MRRDFFALDLLAFFEHHQHAVVGFRRADAVDAAYAGDDDAIAALEQRAGGGETQFIEFFVDGGFFFDVDVAGGNVGFGLIVIVVADEVLDGVRREIAFEFLIQLRGQRLVVRQHQGRAIGGLDHFGHGEGLARAGDSKQNLVLVTVAQAAQERFNSSGLVASRLIVDPEPEGHPSIIKERANATRRECPNLRFVSAALSFRRLEAARFFGQHGAGAVWQRAKENRCEGVLAGFRAAGRVGTQRICRSTAAFRVSCFRPFRSGTEFISDARTSDRIIHACDGRVGDIDFGLGKRALVSAFVRRRPADRAPSRAVSDSHRDSRARSGRNSESCWHAFGTG